MKLEFTKLNSRTNALIGRVYIELKNETVTALDISKVIAEFLEKQEVCKVQVSSLKPKIFLSFQILPMKTGLLYIEDKCYNKIFNYEDFVSSLDDLKPRYLTYVDPEYNNNKYYQIQDNGDGRVKCIYGRIGCNENESFGRKETFYPIYMYYIKYYEKIRKGYSIKDNLIENTEIKTVKQNKSYKKHKNEECQEVLEQLLLCSRQLVEDNYSISPVNVSKKMIKEATSLINKLGTYKTVSAFNKCLIKIFETLPRKMSNVKDHIANSKDDLKEIYEKEYDLLNSMILVMESNNNEIERQKAIDEAFGFSLSVGTDDDINKVKSLLDKDLVNKVNKVFVINNSITEKKFKENLKNDKYPTTKMLWHGSGTENWLSIMKTGLILNPNAAITGKMFGQGIYFAPSATKSWNYTSGRGSYWKGGSDVISYMGLFETEYGNPLDIYDYSNNGYATFDSFKAENPNKHCLHAHSGGTYLRNDEIIFYKESQVVMRYLVQFKERY